MIMTKRSSTPLPGEVPQYRLTEPAYIDDVYYDQRQVDRGEAVIYFTGPPGAHMQPLNDAARSMVEEHKPKKVDPINTLTTVGPAPAA